MTHSCNHKSLLLAFAICLLTATNLVANAADGMPASGKKAQYMHMEFVGGMMGQLVESGGNNLAGGGFFSEPSSIGGSTSIALGIDVLASLKRFSLDIEFFGRWTFQKTSFSIGSDAYMINDMQMVGALFKPGIKINNRIAMFGIIGTSALFFFADNINGGNRDVDSMSFALVYGIGASASITNNLSFVCRFFGLAPIHGLISINGTSIAINMYAMDFGMRLAF
jgi:opacity protein-like surface antigen